MSRVHIADVNFNDTSVCMEITDEWTNPVLVYETDLY